MSKLLAPNGKPSNLTPEQYKLVRSSEFKAWFGDWENDLENSSKVIDEETKEPLVVYHGSYFNGNIFKIKYNNDGVGLIYFSNKKIVAEKYGRIREFFLKVQNLDEIDLDYRGFNDAYDNTSLYTYLRETEDGLLMLNIYDDPSGKKKGKLSNVYAVKYPNQIKLADGSNTTFDANNNDIRYAGGGGVKKISNDRKISTIKTNVKSIVKALSSYLKENDIKYDLDIAKTGSSYFTFKKCDLDFKIRIANHTKGYTGDDADEEDIFIGYSSIDVDSSINGLNSKEIIDIIEKSCIYYPLFENVSIDYFKNNLSYLYGYQNKQNAFELIKQKTGVEINSVSEFFYYNTYNDLQTTDVFIEYKKQKDIELKELKEKENYLSISDYLASNGVSIKTNNSKNHFDWKYNYDLVLEKNNWKFINKENERNYLMEAREELLQKIKNNEFKRGGRTIAQTPAPKKERVYGSNTNKEKSSESNTSAKQIVFNDNTLKSIKNKVDKHNEENPDKLITLSSAKAVVRRGMGAYSSSHRPTIKGGKPNSRVAWGLARLNAFIYKVKNGVSKSGKYTQDDDLINDLNIKYNIGGDISDASYENVKKDKLNYLDVLSNIWSNFNIKF